MNMVMIFGMDMFTTYLLLSIIMTEEVGIDTFLQNFGGLHSEIWQARKFYTDNILMKLGAALLMVVDVCLRRLENFNGKE